MRISDWSSDVCSSDLQYLIIQEKNNRGPGEEEDLTKTLRQRWESYKKNLQSASPSLGSNNPRYIERSEEHTSELQSLMRISYAVFCLKKKTKTYHHTPPYPPTTPPHPTPHTHT